MLASWHGVVFLSVFCTWRQLMFSASPPPTSTPPVVAHFRGGDAIRASADHFSRARQSASLYMSINTRLLWTADGKKQRNHRLPEWGHCNTMGASVRRYGETWFVKRFSSRSTQECLFCSEGLAKSIACLSKERGRYVTKKGKYHCVDSLRRHVMAFLFHHHHYLTDSECGLV